MMPICELFTSALRSSRSCATTLKTLTDKRPPATLSRQQGETVMYLRLQRVMCGMGLVVGLTLTACEACDNTTKTGATEGPSEIPCSEQKACPGGWVCKYPEGPAGHPHNTGVCEVVRCAVKEGCKSSKTCPDEDTIAECDYRTGTEEFCGCNQYHSPKDPPPPPPPTTGGS
jgi:hypothetical protein